jgi:hypothetical protein
MSVVLMGLLMVLSLVGGAAVGFVFGYVSATPTAPDEPDGSIETLTAEALADIAAQRQCAEDQLRRFERWPS